MKYQGNENEMKEEIKMAKYCMKCGQELPQEAKACDRCATPCPELTQNTPPLYRITDNIISGKAAAPTAAVANTASGIAGGTIKGIVETTKIPAVGVKNLDRGKKTWIGVVLFALITIIGLFIPVASDNYDKVVLFQCAFSRELATEAYGILVAAVISGGLAIWGKRLLAMIASCLTAIILIMDINQEAMQEMYSYAGMDAGYFILMLGAIGLLVCGVANYVLPKIRK